MPKTFPLVPLACGFALALGLARAGTAQDAPAPAVEPAGLDLATAPPVVVETSPRAGDAAVEPGVRTLSVTFSKPMLGGSWSWSSVAEGSVPAFVGKPAYAEDGLTCAVEVELEPATTYGVWLNSGRFGNFKDEGGRPAVPYLLVFRTADAGAPAPGRDADPAAGAGSPGADGEEGRAEAPRETPWVGVPRVAEEAATASTRDLADRVFDGSVVGSEFMIFDNPRVGLRRLKEFHPFFRELIQRDDLPLAIAGYFDRAADSLSAASGFSDVFKVSMRAGAVAELLMLDETLRIDPSEAAAIVAGQRRVVDALLAHLDRLPAETQYKDLPVGPSVFSLLASSRALRPPTPDAPPHDGPWFTRPARFPGVVVEQEDSVRDFLALLSRLRDGVYG